MSSCSRYLAARDRAVAYFVSHLSSEGELCADGVPNDPVVYCKLPSLLIKAGKIKEATAVLDYIEKHFISADGDVRASAEVKSANGAMCEYAIYMNGWVAMAASMLGRRDLVEKLKCFYCSYHDKETGAWFTNSSRTTLDLLTTAHMAKLALIEKDIRSAEASTAFLLKAVDAQPADGAAFYHRTDPSGALVTSFSADVAPFRVIRASEPKQLYFFAGYPAAVLALAYVENQQNTAFVEGARSVLDFCLGCHGSMYSFHFAHKVAYAAAIVAGVTKEGEKYARMSEKIADYLLTEQQQSGLFLADAEPMDKYDQSAEIALWMHEISQNLAHA